MKTLIVEDDFVSRMILHDYLSPFGRCDMAIIGNEAVWAFEYACRQNDPYNLICLDILLPVMDGFEVLQKIREIEWERDIYGLYGAKVIITTSMYESKYIIRAFKSQCEGYLLKPIARNKLVQHMIDLQLLDPSEHERLDDQSEVKQVNDFVEKGEKNL